MCTLNTYNPSVEFFRSLRLIVQEEAAWNLDDGSLDSILDCDMKVGFVKHAVR